MLQCSSSNFYNQKVVDQYNKNSSNHSSLSIYSQNVNGLRTKLDIFHAEVLAAIFSIYTLTETGLSDSISSHEVFPSNFNVFRCDRSCNTSTKSRGGGVLIAVMNCFDSELLYSGDIDGCEQIWVKVSHNHKILLIGSLYIPPSSPANLYENHLKIIKTICNAANNDSSILLFGDFNLPLLRWQQNDDIINTYIPININSPEETITDECHDIGLFQINYHYNDNDKLLDLLWTNEPELSECLECYNYLLTNEIHHKAIVTNFDFNFFPLISNIHETYLDYSHANYTVINDELSKINWDELLLNCSIDEMLDNFYNSINSIIDKHIDKKIKKKLIHPKWFDKISINLKNQMNSLHKKFKKYNSQNLRNSYHKKRKEFKSYIRKRYYNYKIEMQQLINENPQMFFKHVNFLKHQSDDLPSNMKYNDNIASTPDEIVDQFKLFFESVYKTPNCNAKQIFDENSRFTDKIRNIFDIIPNIYIDEQLIENQIKELPENLVSGPDNIPNLFLKRCCEFIVGPITTMLQKSFNEGLVPSLWKSSYIRPVFKNGSRRNVADYRGVAIQCSIPKLLDSILAKHINSYLSNIITDHQHGFLSGRSTITNLSDFISNVNHGINSHKQVDAIYLDISKAFDTVDIRLLCHKLDILGLNPEILSWIRNYLCGRTQLVKINSSISNIINVTSGVGQGYPIGATLFIIYLIDLPLYVTNSSIHLFADDAKLSLAVNSNIDCENLQRDLLQVTEYFSIHFLDLNIRKTKIITFTRKYAPITFDYCIYHSIIERVSEIKDLGVILDRKLSFTSHFDYIVLKAKSRLAWIKRFSYEFDDPWVIKRLFTTFVSPILEYASQIWSPQFKVHTLRIESIQKQFLLFALRKFHWKDRFHLPSYKHRLLLLQMNTLEDRRKIASIIFVFSILMGIIQSPSLLRKLNIRIPVVATRILRTSTMNDRNTDLLITDLNSNDPFTLMMNLFNDHFIYLDFNQGVNSIRNILKNHFKLNR